MPSPRPRRRYGIRHWETLLAVFIIVYISVSRLLASECDLRDKVRIIPETTLPILPSLDVSRSAYVQYATTFSYLNLAILNFIALRTSKTRVPNLLILFNEELQLEDKFVRFSVRCHEYNIKLKPVPLIKAGKVGSSTWQHSYTKFHIFNQGEYDKLVYFDADSILIDLTIVNGNLVYQPGNLDELFNLPNEFDLSLPHAYWIESKQSVRYRSQTENEFAITFDDFPSLMSDQQVLSDRHHSFFASHVMVLTPSTRVFNELLSFINNPWYWHILHRGQLKQRHDYDMEILNKYLQDSLKTRQFKLGILPHQVYGVLTGEFHQQSHFRYNLPPQLAGVKITNELMKQYTQWNAMETIQHIKLLHFSDSPIPKPWEPYTIDVFTVFCEGQQPTTVNYQPRVHHDCDSVMVWNWIRAQFAEIKAKSWIE